MVILCQKNTNEVVLIYHTYSSISQVPSVELEHHNAYVIDSLTPVDIPQGKSVVWYHDGTTLSHNFIDIPPAPQTEQDQRLDALQAKLDYLAIMTGNEEVL